MATRLAFENVKLGDGRAMRRAAETTYLTFKKWFDWTSPKDCAMPVLRGMAKEERNLKIKEAIAFLKSVPGFEKHVARLEEGQRRISAWEFTIDRNPWPGPFRDLNLALAGAKLRIGARLGEFSSYLGQTGTIIYGGDANPGLQPSEIRYTDPETGKKFIMPIPKGDENGSLDQNPTYFGFTKDPKDPTKAVWGEVECPAHIKSLRSLGLEHTGQKSKPSPEEIIFWDESGAMLSLKPGVGKTYREFWKFLTSINSTPKKPNGQEPKQ